jgi:hypothetical protein
LRVAKQSHFVWISDIVCEVNRKWIQNWKLLSEDAPDSGDDALRV